MFLGTVFCAAYRRVGNSKTNDKSSALLPSQVQRAISSRPVLERNILTSAQPGKYGRGTYNVGTAIQSFGLFLLSIFPLF